MMSRSVPSYGPADITRSSAAPFAARDTSGAVIVAAQHARHTGPASGSSSTDPHAAHDGAITSAIAGLSARPDRLTPAATIRRECAPLLPIAVRGHRTRELTA